MNGTPLGSVFALFSLSVLTGLVFVTLGAIWLGRKDSNKEHRKTALFWLAGLIALIAFFLKTNLRNETLIATDIWLCLAGGYCFFFGYIFGLFHLKFVCYWYVIIGAFVALYIFTRNDILLGLFLALLGVDIVVKTLIYRFLVQKRPKTAQTEDEV